MCPEPSESIRGGGRLRRALGMAVLVLLVGFAFFYLRRHGTELAERIEWRSQVLIPLALAEASLLFVRGLLTRELCGFFQVRLGVVEAAGLAAWTALANYLTPMVGGTGVRALYLKRRHDLPYSAFASVQAATYTLHFAIAALIGLGCLIALPRVDAGPRAGVATFFLVVLGATLVVRRWPFPDLRPAGRLARFVNRLVAGWREIHGANLTTVVVLLLINMILQATALTLSFSLLGVALGPAQALFIAALSVFAVLIAITPAALGITEGIVVFAATLVGVAAPLALSAAAARRVVAMTIVAIAAGFGSVGRRAVRE